MNTFKLLLEDGSILELRGDNLHQAYVRWHDMNPLHHNVTAYVKDGKEYCVECEHLQSEHGTKDGWRYCRVGICDCGERSGR